MPDRSEEITLGAVCSVCSGLLEMAAGVSSRRAHAREYNDTARVLRVAPATIAIFSVVVSPFLLAALQTFWSGKQVWFGLVACVLYAALLWWMGGRTVQLAPGRLIHRVFFTRKEIDVSAVVSARIVARPAPTLELRHQGSRKFEPAFIVKPFTRAGVAAMLRHIQQCSPNAKLDAFARSMSEGDFELIARESIRAEQLMKIVLLVAALAVVTGLARMLLG